MKNFAVVENGKVINIILAEDDFAKMYSESPDHVGECFEYDEMNEDDTKVACIGDSFLDGKFIAQQAQVTSITKIQAMRKLKSIGMWDEFKAMLALNQDANDEWILSNSLDINSPFVKSLAPKIGITLDQLQILFNEASKEDFANA